MVLTVHIHHIVPTVQEGRRKEKKMQKKSLIASVFGVIFASLVGNSSVDAAIAKTVAYERNARAEQISSVAVQSPLLFSKVSSSNRDLPQTHYSHASHSSHSSHFSHSSHRSSY